MVQGTSPTIRNKPTKSSNPFVIRIGANQNTEPKLAPQESPKAKATKTLKQRKESPTVKVVKKISTKPPSVTNKNVLLARKPFANKPDEKVPKAKSDLKKSEESASKTGVNQALREAAQRLYAPPKRVASVDLKPKKLPSENQAIARANSALVNPPQDLANKSKLADAMKSPLLARKTPIAGISKTPEVKKSTLPPKKTESSVPTSTPKPLDVKKAPIVVKKPSNLASSNLQRPASREPPKLNRASTSIGAFRTVPVRDKDLHPAHRRVVYQEVEQMLDSKENQKTETQVPGEPMQTEPTGGKIVTRRCGICGRGLPLNVNGICTACLSHFQKNKVKIGTLEEFKVYTDNIAHSVKKIVAIGDDSGDGKSDVGKELWGKLRETVPRMIEDSKNQKQSDVRSLQRHLTDSMITTQMCQLPPPQTLNNVGNNSIVASNALVPLGCTPDNAITFGSGIRAIESDSFHHGEVDENLMGAYRSSLTENKDDETKAMPLTRTLRILEENDDAASNVSMKDFKMKKSQTFAHPSKAVAPKNILGKDISVKRIKALEYHQNMPEQSLNESDVPNKALVLRARTDVGFRRSARGEFRLDEGTAVKTARDKSSSVDPPSPELSRGFQKAGKLAIANVQTGPKNEGSMSSILSKDSSSESGFERKTLADQGRSVTISRFKRVFKNSLVKTEKDAKLKPPSSLLTKEKTRVASNAGKQSLDDHSSSSSSSKSRKGPTKAVDQRRSKETEEEKEEEEDGEEGSDLRIYSLIKKLQDTNKNVNVTSEAIRAIEEQRKKQSRRAQKNPVLPSRSNYGSLNGRLSEINKEPHYDYKGSATSVAAFNARGSASSSAVSSFVENDQEKKPPSEYWERSGAQSDLGFYTDDQQQSIKEGKIQESYSDEEYYTYSGSCQLDNSFKETDIDNGRCVYVSKKNLIKSSCIPVNKAKETSSEHYFNSDIGVKKSFSDFSAGTTLSRDLALGSGENPKATVYWDGLIGQIYQFAKDITFPPPPVLKQVESPSFVKETNYTVDPSSDVYTGGFFFKNKTSDNSESSASTTTSISSSIYCDSDSKYAAPLSQDSSKSSDLYTGEVFANSRSNDGELSSKQSESEHYNPLFLDQVAKDGSTNNSAPPPRVSRRQRVRHSVDLFIEKSLDAGELFGKTLRNILPVNISNNSSVFFTSFNQVPGNDDVYVDRFGEVIVQEQRAPQTSTSSEYTGYLPGMKSFVEQEPTPQEIRPTDFTKYDSMDSSTGFFFSSTQETPAICSQCCGNTNESRTNESKDVCKENSDIYTSEFTTKFNNNDNNSYTGGTVSQNTNNNYPNYEAMYCNNKAQQEEQERQKRIEMERMRRIQEEMNSYTSYSGETVSGVPESSYGNSQPESMSSPWMAATEPARPPAYFDMPATLTLNNVAPIEKTQPKTPARPMLMKLGAITVRNNVENDNHYAANINMDLKGCPGAHPVPIEDGTRQMSPGKMAEQEPRNNWQYQEDSYASNYAAESSYSEMSGPIQRNWKDGSIARESWRGDSRESVEAVPAPVPVQVSNTKNVANANANSKTNKNTNSYLGKIGSIVKGLF